MNEMAFDGIKSKLVPDEKLIACTIDRINEKSNAKLKYSIGWVKCAAFALVLAIIISVLPLALKNNNSNNPIVPPQTEAGDSTDGAAPIDYGYEKWRETCIYSLVKIIKYDTDCLKRRLFPINGEDVDGVLATVEILYDPNGYSGEMDIYIPICLYEEQYDYLVINIFKMRVVNIYTVYPDTIHDRIGGFAFKDGKVDLNNEYFTPIEESCFFELNKLIEEADSNPKDKTGYKQYFPDFCIEDGLSVDKVKLYLEKAAEASACLRELRRKQREEREKNGIYVPV